MANVVDLLKQYQAVADQPAPQAQPSPVALTPIEMLSQGIGLQERRETFSNQQQMMQQALQNQINSQQRYQQSMEQIFGQNLPSPTGVAGGPVVGNQMANETGADAQGATRAYGQGLDARIAQLTQASDAAFTARDFDTGLELAEEARDLRQQQAALRKDQIANQREADERLAGILRGVSDQESFRNAIFHAGVNGFDVSEVVEATGGQWNENARQYVEGLRESLVSEEEALKADDRAVGRYLQGEQLDETRRYHTHQMGIDKAELLHKREKLEFEKKKDRFQGKELTVAQKELEKQAARTLNDQMAANIEFQSKAVPVLKEAKALLEGGLRTGRLSGSDVGVTIRRITGEKGVNQFISAANQLALLRTESMKGAMSEKDRDFLIGAEISMDKKVEDNLAIIRRAQNIADNVAAEVARKREWLANGKPLHQYQSPYLQGKQKWVSDDTETPTAAVPEGFTPRQAKGVPQYSYRKKGE